VPVLDDVRSAGPVGADLDFSLNGIFVYHSGERLARARILWLDRAGKQVPLNASPDLYYYPRLSPDGKRLVYQFTTGTNVDIWVRDIAREGNVPSRLTFGGGPNQAPVWTPDGRNIVFSGGPTDHRGIYSVRSDGSGSPQRIGEAVAGDTPDSFSPDGKRLAVQHARDIYIAEVEGGPDHLRLGKRELLAGTPANEVNATFSPDGKWIAYTSDATGTPEVYVRPSHGEGIWQISQQGGSFPRWSLNGRELLYAAAGRVTRVECATNGNSLIPGMPQPWIGSELPDLGGAYAYDVTPDGRKLIIDAPPEDPNANKPDTQFNVLVNFADEIKRRLNE
jgi:Tol biopolymer transport system component